MIMQFLSDRPSEMQSCDHSLRDENRDESQFANPTHLAKHWRATAASAVAIAGTGILIGLPWLFQSCFLLGMIGYTCLIMRAAEQSPLRAASESFACGLIALAIAFHWASNSIFGTTHLSYTMSILVFIGLIVWEAIAFGLLGLASCMLRSKGPRWLWLLVPIWVTIETHWPRIFSWATAHAYLGFPPILQIAEIAGTAGVTAIALMGSVALARYWRFRSSAQAMGEAALAFTMILICCGWGVYAFASWQERIGAASTLRIAAIQVDPTYVESLGKMQQLSDHVSGAADLVLWPESTLGNYSVSLDHFGDEDFTVANSEMPNPALLPYPDLHCDLLAGGKTYEVGQRDQGVYKNTAFLIDRQQSIIGRYVKRSLMPIGEYVPGETWFPVLRDWAAVSDKIVCGTSNMPLELSHGQRVGMLVCYEDMVADNAASSVREGAEVLVALANGSAFKDPDTLRQHLKLAQLRSIENRRAMIRCAATGVTCLIQPDGTITDELPIGEDGVLCKSVPLFDDTTFYTRNGNWVAESATWITLALVPFLLFRGLAPPDSPWSVGH
ncbi:apolipoprotein N-acyltransferase [Rubripirellula reticaptiva]|uniref:Apolipoprotein N-acyltransferase n=1 Tax=Rubripirellula reticaptiva TaxID=2528013 RepID=A0A5C6EHN9_9BACT|nr:apolipoprotein N-acyltransferase [Rubripirellula reticaptiva]TWU48060.1 Apolipoprotein N-acyltransferase [Rubripirellula reticaptiva]